MDRLWTPWRFQYVSQPSSSSTEEEDCFLCSLPRSAADTNSYVLHRGAHCYVLLNRYPYTNGHLMIVPFRHLPFLEDLNDEESIEMMLLARRAQTALRQAYRPEGFNLGMNLGSCAGAGVAGHLHLHLLPRWSGDTNFMTVTGETRVLPEDLSSTYEKLRPFFLS